MRRDRKQLMNTLKQYRKDIKTIKDLSHDILSASELEKLPIDKDMKDEIYFYSNGSSFNKETMLDIYYDNLAVVKGELRKLFNYYFKVSQELFNLIENHD